MRIALSADENVGIAHTLEAKLRERGHEPILHGALTNDRPDWAWASEAAARDVAQGRADQAIVCCWTGTGTSIGVLALSLRTLSEPSSTRSSTPGSPPNRTTRRTSRTSRTSTHRKFG